MIRSIVDVSLRNDQVVTGTLLRGTLGDALSSIAIDDSFGLDVL